MHAVRHGMGLEERDSSGWEAGGWCPWEQLFASWSHQEVFVLAHHPVSVPHGSSQAGNTL